MSRRRIALVVGALIVTIVFLRLGFWQLDRYNGRRARSEARVARGALPELVWGPDAPLPADTAGLVGRRLRVTGRYDFEHEAILRSRSPHGEPGVEVLTPLRVNEDGPALMVLRGWLPADDGIRARLSDGWSGEQTGSDVEVSGVLIFPAGGPPGPPLEMEIEGRRHVTLGAIDLANLRERLPFEVSPHVLRADDPTAGSGALRPASQVITGTGPHLSYAIQWFAFALISVVGTATLLTKERRGESPKVL